MRPGHLALREPTLWRYDDVLPVDGPGPPGDPGRGLHAAPRRPPPRRGLIGLPAALHQGRRRAIPRAPSRRAACPWPSPWPRRWAPPTCACPRRATRAAPSPPTRRAGGLQGPRLRAQGRRAALPHGDARVRRRRGDGGRPDHRRRQGLRGAGEGERLVRVRDPEGALPRRGQEDDGLRDRRADGLEAARRHPLPHRRAAPASSACGRPSRRWRPWASSARSGRACTRCRPRAARPS